MINSNKSHITLVTPGNNKSITWGTHSEMNFSSANTVTAGSVFKNTVGTTINFAGGPELLWSTSVVIKYDLKDVYRYHLRGTTSIGRNTAMKQQTYFYASAGFGESQSDDEVKKYLSKLETTAYRHKLTNYILKAMSIAYKLTSQIDSTTKVFKQQPTWTESTRRALQTGTSGVAFVLGYLRSMIVSYEGWMYKLGYWKNFMRNDFQPNALIQASKKKGIFLGAQYQTEAGGEQNHQFTTAALHLDNTVRLKSAKSTLPQANIYYPRDVQPQSSMSATDWISPEKIITEIKSRAGKEPTEYSEFNGFRGSADSNLELAPGRISVWSDEIFNHAAVHSAKAITPEALNHLRAEDEFNEVSTKTEIARQQLEAITQLNEPDAAPLSAAQLAIAPLAAAAVTANATQRAILLAEATQLLATLEAIRITLGARVEQLALALNNPAVRRHSLITQSSDFFEISYTNTNDVAQVRGTQAELTLTKKTDGIPANDAALSLTSELVTLKCSDNSAILLAKDELGLAVGYNGLMVANGTLDLYGGGGRIEMANNSVKIGSLKISNLNERTKLKALENYKTKTRQREQKHRELTAKLTQDIAQQTKEIEDLKRAVANLGQQKKKK